MFLQLARFLRPKLISGTAEWPQNSICARSLELGMDNCNYRRPNMAMSNSHGTDNGHLKNVNMMFQ